MGARARRAERGRLPAARRRYLGRDAVQAGRRLDRRLRLRRDLHERAGPRAHESSPGRRTRARAREPRAIQHLPAAIHEFTSRPSPSRFIPVFLTATAVMVVAFGLSWRLRDVPLRETAGSDAPDRDVPADAYVSGASHPEAAGTRAVAAAQHAPQRRSGDEPRADRSYGGDDVEAAAARSASRSRSGRSCWQPSSSPPGLDRIDQERPARHLRLWLRRRRPLAVGDGDGAAARLEPAGVLDAAGAGDHGRHRCRRAGDGAGSERRCARLQPRPAADRRPRQAERSGQRPQQERLPRDVGEAHGEITRGAGKVSGGVAHVGSRLSEQSPSSSR